MKRRLRNTLPFWAIHTLLIFSCTKLSAQLPPIDYGKSYVNITKGLNGGTVETGDTLEIRSTFVVRTGFFDSCAFTDVVPAGTVYLLTTLKVLTNEGKIYKSFTDAPGDDCGWIIGNNITINLGFNPADAAASATRRGRIRNTHKPSFYGSTCILIASYRVKVTAALGSTINTGGGSVSYKPNGQPITSITFGANKVAVYTNSGTCPNAIGVNSLGTEFNGTFGSGKPRNRGISANVPASYTYNVFTTNSPQDYYYGVANNTSTENYSTSNAWLKPDLSSPTHRVFQVWDIIGDHTGAVSPTLGNPAADTVANPNAGYMLVINASYKTDSAFQHTISGLCPNTYYELSMWIRNICSKCSCDSNGKGANNAAGPPFYIPTAPGDSSGVYPNLTFGIDGTDYYSSGNVLYTGQWVKKGFTYLTGPAQSSFTMTIKNNAPGGGGNDWALDDISVATCTPNLTMQPSPIANVCYGNQVDLSCKVRCYFSNYINWTWEKSTDGGVTWTNTGSSGTGIPVLVGGQYEYTANYPSFIADSSQNSVRYRIRVASTAGNLGNANCSFADMTTIVVWVNNCTTVLPTNFKSFSGQPVNGYSKLQWETENENSSVVYEIERSGDRIHFTTIGTVSATGYANGQGSYTFTDPQVLTDHKYYRIKMINNNAYKYSRVILLSNGKLDYSIRTLINPFNESVSFEMISPENGSMKIGLIDLYGRLIRQSVQNYNEGSNTIRLNDLQSLPAATYTLQIIAGGNMFTRKVIKLNN